LREGKESNLKLETSPQPARRQAGKEVLNNLTEVLKKIKKEFKNNNITSNPKPLKKGL
jgi:hypothetical protein